MNFDPDPVPGKDVRYRFWISDSRDLVKHEVSDFPSFLQQQSQLFVLDLESELLNGVKLRSLCISVVSGVVSELLPESTWSK